MIKKKAKVSIFGLTIKFMMVNGKMDICIFLVFIDGLMAAVILVLLLKTEEKDKENIFFLVVRYMKDNGKTIFKMEKVRILGYQEINGMVLLSMVKETVKVLWLKQIKSKKNRLIEMIN